MLEPFSGFTTDDLSLYPGWYPDAPLRGKLESFASFVDNRLPPHVKTRFPQFVVDTGHEVRWVRQADAALTPKGSAPGSARDVDLRLEILGHGVSTRGCLTYIKGGSSTEPDTTIGRLAAAVRDRPEELTNLLSQLGPEYKLILYSRDGQGSREPKAWISLDLFGPEMCLALQAALERIPMPGIEVRRCLAPYRADDFTGEALVEWSVAALASLAQVSTFF